MSHMQWIRRPNAISISLWGQEKYKQKGVETGKGRCPTFRVTQPTGPQDNGHQILLGFIIEGESSHQRQVAPRVVVAIEGS